MGKIVEGRLLEDVLLSSPSYAATFIMGTSTSGKVAWKTKDKVTLRDYEEQEGIS